MQFKNIKKKRSILETIAITVQTEYLKFASEVNTYNKRANCHNESRLITLYTIGAPTLSLCVFIAREISKNILSASLGNSLTELFIATDFHLFVTGHCTASNKTCQAQVYASQAGRKRLQQQIRFTAALSTGSMVIYAWQKYCTYDLFTSGLFQNFLKCPLTRQQVLISVILRQHENEFVF